MASPKIDTTEKAKEKIVDNLLVLHTKICNEGDVYSVMDFTKYLFKLLDKRGKKFEYLVKGGKEKHGLCKVRTSTMERSGCR